MQYIKYISKNIKLISISIVRFAIFLLVFVLFCSMESISCILIRFLSYSRCPNILVME